MLRIWLIYNLLISGLIVATTISGGKSITQFALPLLLLPLIYYLAKELKRKPKLRAKPSNAVFASSLPVADEAPALVGEVMPNDGISDDNRRIFLKLIGSTGLSLIFMAVLGKKSAQAAFFGSVPGPGSVAVKNIAGDVIDPAEKQSTDGYEISEVDDTGAISYYGFVHKSGAWYITKEDATGGYRYAKGASAFSTGWTDRAGLTYDYFDAVF